MFSARWRISAGQHCPSPSCKGPVEVDEHYSLLGCDVKFKRGVCSPRGRQSFQGLNQLLVRG
jgi:hypothetical protein